MSAMEATNRRDLVTHFQVLATRLGVAVTDYMYIYACTTVIRILIWERETLTMSPIVPMQEGLEKAYQCKLQTTVSGRDSVSTV